MDNKQNNHVGVKVKETQLKNELKNKDARTFNQNEWSEYDLAEEIDITNIIM